MFHQLKNDLSAGLIASLVPFPKAMALGALVMTPLGVEYIPIGVIAGLLSKGWKIFLE